MDSTLTLEPPKVRWDLSALFSGLDDPKIEETWLSATAAASQFGADRFSSIGVGEVVCGRGGAQPRSPRSLGSSNPEKQRRQIPANLRRFEPSGGVHRVDYNLISRRAVRRESSSGRYASRASRRRPSHGKSRSTARSSRGRTNPVVRNRSFGSNRSGGSATPFRTLYPARRGDVEVFQP